MRINLDDGDILGIDMGPLIDCMFLLLIFFLVATTFKKKDEEHPPLPVAVPEKTVDVLPVKLPDPALAAGPSKELSPISLAVDEAGSFYISRTKVSRSTLTARIREMRKYDAGREIRLEIDRSAPSARLIELLDIFAYEGITNYGIHTMARHYGE